MSQLPPRVARQVFHAATAASLASSVASGAPATPDVEDRSGITSASKRLFSCGAWNACAEPTPAARTPDTSRISKGRPVLMLRPWRGAHLPGGSLLPAPPGCPPSSLRYNGAVVGLRRIRGAVHAPRPGCRPPWTAAARWTAGYGQLRPVLGTPADVVPRLPPQAFCVLTR